MLNKESILKMKELQISELIIWPGTDSSNIGIKATQNLYPEYGVKKGIVINNYPIDKAFKELERIALINIEESNVHNKPE